MNTGKILRSMGLREDVVVPIPRKYLGENGNESGKEDAEGGDNGSASDIEDAEGGDNGSASDKEDAEGGDGSDSADSEFYDSDWDAEDGDDDLFLDNVDKDVNNNNEPTDIVEQEDDAGLEHEDLNLSKEEYSKLTYKFKEFNAEVDMEAPIFKVGMLFSSMEEFRRALNSYNVNERVKIRKTRNEATRLHAMCEGFHEFGCPWKIKVSLDNRKEAYAVKEYCNDHTCERVWELKTLTAPFLTTCFMDEFRDNQKLDLKAFAANVQRRFNMCPNRFKLGRARKAALNIIHGDEEEQFALLCDYGQELRRSNPVSKFFLSTNQIKEHSDPEPKEHLATLYWSYDACKRGFLEGCRPFICLDGCHIKTRSTNIPTWERNMEKLKVDSEEAWKWVEELPPNTFVKAFFSDFPKCDMLLNNHSEVFNSYILEAREFDVLSMLETLFYKMMHRNVGKLKEADKWTGTICPKIKKKIDKATEWAKKLGKSSFTTAKGSRSFA
ncbi:hypothetical protein ACQ4PT_059958 [Festuca glaucescens]